MGVNTDGRWFAPCTVALVLAFALQTQLVPAADKVTLTDLELSTSLQVAANTNGEVLTLDSDVWLFSVWNDEGELLEQAEVNDMRLHGLPYTIAFRERRALICFVAGSASNDVDRQFVVVDIGKGEVVSSFHLKGMAVSAAPGPDGWLLLLRQFPPPGDAELPFTLVLVDDTGREQKAYDMPPELTELVNAAGLFGPGPWVVRPFHVDKEVWFASLSAYELWRPAQRGRPAMRISPPDCLAAQGRQLLGEDAEKELLRRAGSDSVAQKKAEDLIARNRNRPSSSPSRPSSMTGFIGSVAAVSAYEDQVAVVVRESGERSSGCRIDIWDMTREGLVGTQSLPEDTCPGFVALGEETAWIWVGRNLQSVPLRISLLPLADPCAVTETGAGVAQSK